MATPLWLEHAFFATVDFATAVWPRTTPARGQLRDCLVVAHRGMHGSGGFLENTLPAFDGALAAGAWGLEFDVRWTRDRVPVVYHDIDCRRLFRTPMVIGDTEFRALREAFPQIPTLEEVIRRYGKRAHLMIEIKTEPTPMFTDQFETLRELVDPLVPATDFHVLAYDADLLEALAFLPNLARLALAKTDTRRKSQLALARGYGGLLGHYALLSTALIKRHTSVGQCVGTGFVSSRKCFFREVTRGVRWTFTNTCNELSQLRTRMLDVDGQG